MEELHMEELSELWVAILSQYRELGQRSNIFIKYLSKLREVGEKIPLIVHPYQIANTLELYWRIKYQKGNRINKSVRKIREVLIKAGIINSHNEVNFDFFEFQRCLLSILLYAMKNLDYIAKPVSESWGDIRKRIWSKFNAAVMKDTLRILARSSILFGSGLDRITLGHYFFEPSFLHDKDARKILYSWLGALTDILGGAGLVSFNIYESHFIKEILWDKSSGSESYKYGYGQRGYIIVPTAITYKVYEMIEQYTSSTFTTIYFNTQGIINYLRKIDEYTNRILNELKESVTATKEGLNITDKLLALSDELLRIINLNSQYSLFIIQDVFRALFLKMTLLNRMKFDMKDLLFNGRLVRR